MADTFQHLVKAVSTQLSGLENVEQLDDGARFKLGNDLRDLLQELQPPSMIMQNLTGGVHAMVATKVASSMGVFDAFAANDNKKAMTSDELHSQTKGEKALLVRILRLLTAHGLVRQVSTDLWQPTAYGSSFTNDSMESILLEHFYEMLPSHATLDEYLRSIDYRNPNDAFNGPWQYGYKIDKHYFGWLEDNDIAQKTFNKVMTVHQQFRGQDWFEFYPVSEKLTASSTNKDVPLLVDIGGGVGHDAIALTNKYPELNGRVVVQDLPRVIESITSTLPNNIQAQAHDMFAEQPIRNAGSYYLRTVLHDWPDKQALQILQRIREACSPDSILFINEDIVYEDSEVSWTSATRDLVMMLTCSALERTQAQWDNLLTQAGFKLVKVWKPTSEFNVGSVALLEAVPV